MELLLLRHGIAEDGRPGLADPDRALTPEGIEKLKRTLARAKAAGVAPTAIVSSPYKRALQTAQLAVEAFRHTQPVSTTHALTPDADVRGAWQVIREHRHEDCLLLAGHNPLFGSLAGYLLGAPELMVDMRKGALVSITIPSFGAVPRGILNWMLVSRLS